MVNVRLNKDSLGDDTDGSAMVVVEVAVGVVVVVPNLNEFRSRCRCVGGPVRTRIVEGADGNDKLTYEGGSRYGKSYTLNMETVNVASCVVSMFPFLW